MFLSDQRDCRYLLESADIDLRLDGIMVPETAFVVPT
jgi:hypothetical protein